jgi:hypothetical protein
MNDNKLLLLLCILICSTFLGLYVYIEFEQWSQYEEYEKSPIKIFPPQYTEDKKFNYSTIVAAALTSITNSPVITHYEYLTRDQNDTRLYEQLDFQIFYKTYLSGGIISPHSEYGDDNLFSVNIESLTGVKFLIGGLSSKTMVRELKERIQEIQENVTISFQQLVFSGQHLLNTAELGAYNIGQNDMIYLDISPEEGSSYFIKFLNSDFLSSGRYLEILKEKHHNRRCGWERIPLSPKEKNKSWPYSYHGTTTRNARTIADDGIIHSKGHKLNFGHGIYTTPDIDLASLYAKSFIYKGSKYLALFQNRVNPKTLVKIPFRKGKHYWVSPSVDDVKPYSLLIKKIGYCK